MGSANRPKALTVAGSDSGGGAGIQADLKTFAACGVYGASVITAVTAQNTRGLIASYDIPTNVIAAQIDAVLGDIGADAVKTGMLSSSAIVETVSRKLREHQVERLVVDPVMVATSGDPLLRLDAVEALKELLLPLAYVVTPNIPEAEVLVGQKLAGDQDYHEAARAIHALGPRYVVVKGGHRGDDANDLLFDGETFQEYRAERIETPHTHGTGCTFASAIAAGLARGLSAPDAVGEAKRYLTEAIRQAYPIGGGRSPVHHFYHFWTSSPISLEFSTSAGESASPG